MQAYMKSNMPYLGVSAVPLRAVCKTVIPLYSFSTFEAWNQAVLKVWRKATCREERYAAIALAGHRLYRPFQTLDAMALYEEMIVTGAWWDYVDALAVHHVGPILRKYPSAMKKKMRAWGKSDDLWKRRTAILCQLSFKQETDLALLYESIECAMYEREFFLRKAIGWALRQYAWTDPGEVARYVKVNRASLSALSVREALKNLAE